MAGVSLRSPPNSICCAMCPTPSATADSKRRPGPGGRTIRGDYGHLMLGGAHRITNPR